MNLIWDPDSPKVWDAFHREQRGALQQSWGYGAALVGGGETEVEAKTFFEEGAGPAAEASAEAAPADEKPAKKKRRGMGESQD